MTLRVYNTLHRKKEEFKPIKEGQVGVYVCGPTVYGHSHIGHAKSYICFDVVVRFLRYLGFRVRYVQNITDVGHLTEDTEEDKVLKQSRLENLEPMEVVERYTRSYFEDMDALGVLRPDISPRASGHIPEQIALIEKLMENGYAYASKGSVYFSISKYPGYGQLSGRKVEDQQEGARVAVDPDKQDPRDFLLWRKASPDHILKWRSPWGTGYPGWHLECSAMSMRYLGESIDIHGGGLENQFPHHDCEIAQSECATRKPFVKYWLHNNMVTVDGQKMGKSLGNFITIKDALKRHAPEVLRFAILRTHYRSTMDYSEEALHAARSGYQRLKTAYEAVKSRSVSAPEGPDHEKLAGAISASTKRVVDAMNDDFNTPMALAAAFDLTTEINGALAGPDELSASDCVQALHFYEELVGGILGVNLSRRGESSESLEPKLIDLLIDARNVMRDQKIWEGADGIRDGLESLGILIKDSKEGSAWKRA